MFTGLVEEVGKLQAASTIGEAMRLTIAANKVCKNVQIGDSIAVNGVCLTVTSFNHSSFTADVMPETYRKSNLHMMAQNDLVNLERAMLPTTRFGGHIVQGHVDGEGTIRKKYREGNAMIIEVGLEDVSHLKYMIPKGSVTLEGVSLTIVETNSKGFTVSVIPHTYSETALQYRPAGAKVNIECDIIGKYVEHLLSYQRQETKPTSALSTSFLAEHGFL